MKNLFNLIILLTCLAFACESKAVDINEILHKQVVFKIPSNQNIKFDCFFVLDINNPRKSKEVFAPIGKTTNKEEILGHVFFVDSVIFKNKHQEISDGSIILLTREDGKKIILKTPSYKNNKPFKVNDKNSFYYSLIKVLYLGQKRNAYASAYTKGFIDVYKSYLDLDVYNISKSDSIVNDLMKTNKVFSKNNIIKIPIIKNHTFFFENNVPFYRLSFEDKNRIYKIEDLIALDSVRRYNFREALYVDSIIKNKSFLNVDSLNKIYAGRDFWINTSILSYDTKIPIVHFEHFNNNEWRHIEWIKGGAPIENKWMYINTKRFSEGMIGGEEWLFFRGRIEPISLIPIVLPTNNYGQFDYNYYKRAAKRENWPRCSYYLRIVPSPIYEYKLHWGDKEKTYGVNLPDTIFIPFENNELTKKIKECVLTNEKLIHFENAFYKAEQSAWDAHMNKVKGDIDVLTKVYGRNTAELIAAGKIRFGFTSEMCKLAFSGEPYDISEYAEIPFGPALEYNFYTKDTKLYFIDDKLIGIQWKGKAIEYYK